MADSTSGGSAWRERVNWEPAELDRRLVFNTSVHAGETVVPEGTHQRFVVSP
ncbi:MAG: hypothetical protein OES24_16380 [Acidimicrobiia bacterium]|nr:hypothetical protein [Acidimicrobiia bacterium]